VVIGNPYSGSQLEPSAGAFTKGANYHDERAAVAEGFAINNTTVEHTTQFGSLQIYSGRHIVFENDWFEMGSTTANPTLGHTISIGGGWANDAGQGYRPCVYDNDRGAIACTEAVGGTIVIENTRFVGGMIVADVHNDTYNDDWDSVAIGANFASGNEVVFDTYLGQSDIDGTANNPGDTCADTARVDCRLFSIDTANAGGKVVITNARNNSNVLPPEYLNVFHAGARSFYQYINDTMAADEEGMNIHADNQQFDPNLPASIHLGAGSDGDDVGDWWNVHSFGIAAGAVPAVDCCEFTVREGNSWSSVNHGTFDATQLGASSIVVGDGGGDSLCDGSTPDININTDTMAVPVMSAIDPGGTGNQTITLRGDDLGGELCSSGSVTAGFSLTIFPRPDK
jgi:hypothetical protein